MSLEQRIQRPLVYIAGPFRGKTPWDVAQNVRRAEEVGLAVALQCGAHPIIPHSMTGHFDKQGSDDFWLQGTLELMRRCDAVYLVHTWTLSAGAKAEKEEAERLGIPVFDDLITLNSWVRAHIGRARVPRIQELCQRLMRL